MGKDDDDDDDEDVAKRFNKSQPRVGGISEFVSIFSLLLGNLIGHILFRVCSLLQFQNPSGFLKLL